MKNSLLVLMTFFSLNSFAQFSGGIGTYGDPYLISTKADLKTLCENEAYWGATFLQTADIYFVNSDFTSTGGFYNGGEGFIPIGYSDINTVAFTGLYDGQGHIIDGVYMNRPTTDGVGIFGWIEGGYVVDLIAQNVDITGQYWTGGLAGVCIGNGYVADCFTYGTVTGYSSVGGIIGAQHGSSLLERSYSYCDVTSSNDQVGGLVGDLNNSELRNSYANTQVNGGNYAGGLVGNAAGGSIIANCLSWGNSAGVYGVGGLIGVVNDASVTNCYATGKAEGIDDLGGLIGFQTLGNFTGCYWDVNTSGTSLSAGGTGVSTGFLHDVNNLLSTGWDYVNESANGTDNFWYMVACQSGNGYPMLVWYGMTLGVVQNPTASISGNLSVCSSDSATVYASGTMYHFWSSQADASDSIEVAPATTTDHWMLGMNELGCWSDTVDFTIVNNNTAATINPTFCDVYVSPSGNYSYTSPGTYSDTIQNMAGCDSLITINLTLEVIDVTVNNTSPTLSANQAGATYQWIDCNNGNTAIPGATGQQFTATSNGNYAVVVNYNNCSDTSACFIVDNVGLSSQTLSGIKVYPNPSNGTFKFELEDELKRVELVDLSGRNVEVAVDLSSGLVEAGEIVPGKYLLRIVTVDEEMMFETVIIH